MTDAVPLSTDAQKALWSAFAKTADDGIASFADALAHELKTVPEGIRAEFEGMTVSVDFATKAAD